MSFYIREYKKRARSILKDAIHSAIFIDENALEPFQKETINLRSDASETQKLSKNLYRHFKGNNTTLDIHKFINVDIAKSQIKNKDIVLLDWHLDGVQSGEEFALELLEEIVKEDHLHFCCIYTNSPKDSVINNCVSYFSGHDEAFYAEILEEYELDQDLVSRTNPFLERVFALDDSNNLDKIAEIAQELKKNNELARKVSQIDSLKELPSLSHKLRCLAYANKSDLKKSKNKSTPTINFLNRLEYVFTINNTIIIILNKNHEQDSKTLFNKILSEIIEKHNSYLLMLGLEMQTFLKRSSAFISGDVLDVKNDTIAYHWHQNIKSENEISFGEFVKQIMIDQVNLKIKQAEFTLLKKTNFLNEDSIKKECETEQLARINTFYNGSKILGNRLLNYGDILFDKISGDYYLCITALCDCLHPKNISNRFFFVKGQKFNLKQAIDLSDEAFISYINEIDCISWVQTGTDSNKDKHKPVYIKPIQLYVNDSNLIDDKVTILDWNNNAAISRIMNYRFTLRAQYAQRISNHAFSHPIRVGIDFLKIAK